MQGHLEQQNQSQLKRKLVSLISAALPANPLPSDSSSLGKSGSESGTDQNRAALLRSLHRFIVFPANSIVVSLSAPFLSQGLSQLLSDRSNAVRHAASVSYGALCAITCSQNGQNNTDVADGLSDLFLGWALPLVSDVESSDGSVDVAFEGLWEFLSVGELPSIETYVLKILKSCQEILEDERTSLNLLHQLLRLLSLIAGKYEKCFQPHFIDIVDLLLGCALVPGLLDSDRNAIMDVFLQFKTHWICNLQFSIGLISKFLYDMEVLIQDVSLNSTQHFGRLLALFFCFLTVLQATTSDVVEINSIEQISESLLCIVPRLLGCLAMVGKKFGWNSWIEEFWKCLVLIAGILKEKFSNFYANVVEILFQISPVLPASLLLGMLKVNLQLLHLQKSELLPSCVKTILQFNFPFSLLRLHPNHLVVGSIAATYLFLLQHDANEVLSQAIASLMEELELLISLLKRNLQTAGEHKDIQLGYIMNDKLDLHLESICDLCDLELISLVKFDLKLLLACLSSSSKSDCSEVIVLNHGRCRQITSFIMEKLDPFQFPIHDHLQLQVHVIGTLHKLSEVEFISGLTMHKQSNETFSCNIADGFQGRTNDKQDQSSVITDCLKKYSLPMVKALSGSSPSAVKLKTLEWIMAICEAALKMENDIDFLSHIYKPNVLIRNGNHLLTAIIDAASDREQKIRYNVASVLEKVIQAGLVNPDCFYHIAELALERLGDPDASIKESYVRTLSIILPLTFYVYGVFEERRNFCKNDDTSVRKQHFLNWKHILTLKHSPRKFHFQQLVSILSYISHRWKVPLSSWIQRLVFRCRATSDIVSLKQEDGESLDTDFFLLEEGTEGNIIDRICHVNNLASIWWSIHEAARYSVSLRLRTNYGGPTQTFASLERMLLDVAHMLVLDKEQTNGSLNIRTSNLHLLPMRLLLDFVESLKKNVYNAYQGSFVLPLATQQSSLFFRANKKVCEEWFSRILEPMLNAGLALQCQDAVIHYGELRLWDLHGLVSSTFMGKTRGTQVSEGHRLRVKLASDVLIVLRHVALALCRNHEPDALTGLQNWVVARFSLLFCQESQIISKKDGSFLHFSWFKGLVYQARGQYEKAAAHFSHILQSEDVLSSLGSEGIQFVITRIIENYTAISDWKSLENWLSELHTLRAMHTGKAYSGALSAAGNENEINAVHALAHFDGGDIEAASAYLDLAPKSSYELTLDPKLSLERSEYMLLRAMLQKDGNPDKISEEINKSKQMMDEALSVAPLDGLADAMPYFTQLHCIFAFEEGSKLKFSNSQEPVRQLLPMLNSLQHVLHLPISKIHQDSSLWLKMFRVYHTMIPTSPVTLLFCLKLGILARKQGNFLLAKRMTGHLRNNISVLSKGIFFDWVSTCLQYENILLSYAEGRHVEALIDLWSLFGKYIVSEIPTTNDLCNMLRAKACLKLASWFKQESSGASLKNILNRIRVDFSENGLNDVSINRSEFSPNNDDLNSNSTSLGILEEFSGTVIKLSCQFCPTMCKTWLSYASWCFSHGKSCLALSSTLLESPVLSSVLVPELSSDRFQLTEEESTKVKAIITDFFHYIGYENATNDKDKEEMGLLGEGSEALVDSFINQAVHLITFSAGATVVENSTAECPSSAIALELERLLLSANPRVQKDDISSYVNQLVDIWWFIRRRRVSLFGHAAYGYLQYLSYSSSKSQEYKLTNSYVDSIKGKTGTCTLRATLYILQILLNYGVELREVIEPRLQSTPLLPWQEITPQLFARLSSHPQREIRMQLEGLLLLLAKLSPWSIVYPTLVDMNNSEGEPSEELQRIFDCLGKLYPQLIKDVQLVINDLGNMTVLWEEHWLTMLQDLHPDVARRIRTLKEEAKRIEGNSTLSHIEKNKINAAKYSAIMAPVIVALERRLTSTSREPETSHEEWFQKEYGEQLKSALLSLKIPPISLSALGDVWQPFDAITTSLANYQSKSKISLSEVAPRLVMLSSTEVPMPGLEKQVTACDACESSNVDPQGLVTISSFYEHVNILSTKTKPKKLVILGSDGQNYTYLLKGREDLRLDARIMQLLQAINNFIYSCTEVHHSLAIRHYSVTPISGRAGLIQWVDNVTSIYSVFRSWQNRVHLVQKSVPSIPQPSDMFYGKILPALKEKGIKRIISRRDWPHDVKRKVLLDLMKETPRELLRQEIWCASEGFKSFRLKSKRFSGTVAAMSMVGHILGLGDRHLDNILIDFCSGDVVHIDYNVCFDKGHRLKIPEIVPFRLTQIIEMALGLTGTEGAFKSSCEAMIGVLQNNKDVILMLLEVFIWEPLVEWTRGDMHDEATIGGEEKKGMELAVCLSLFAYRFQEIRIPLQEHCDLLVTSLPAVESALEKLLVSLNQHEVVSENFYGVDKERSDLFQHEASTKSFVAEATSISEKALAFFKIQSLEFSQAKSTTSDKAQEVTKWIEQHGRVLDALRNGSILPEFQSLIRLGSMGDSLSLITAVLVSRVPLTIIPEPTQSQSCDFDREVSQLAAELDSGLARALEALQEYALALQRVLPINYITTSPVNGWAQVLQLSVNNLSPEVISVARRQAAELMTENQGDNYDSIQQRHRNLLLSIERYTNELEKVKNECSELMNSIDPEIELRSKEALLSAFSKFMHFTGYLKTDSDESFSSGQSKHKSRNNIDTDHTLEVAKKEIFPVLCLGAVSIFKDVKDNVHGICNNVLKAISRPKDDGLHSNLSLLFCQFEEQIEKSVLVAGILNELDDPAESKLSSGNVYNSEGKWASIFQRCIPLCRTLSEQMTEALLPEIIRSIIMNRSELMEVFGSISQIRGSIDMALKQLAEIESERLSLMELENNYFVKVKLMKERKLSLEEASARGRDNLSWEEADELISHEEACKEQLEQLHQTWNQKDMQISSLAKAEDSIRLLIVTSERHLSTLLNAENEENAHVRRSKALLAMLVNPFSHLESFDQILASYGTHASDSSGSSLPIAHPNFSSPGSMWNFLGLLKEQSFFIWKVSAISTFLDNCVNDISSFVDHNVSFDQICNIFKKKLEVLIQENIGQYWRERVAPIFLECLEKEHEHLQKFVETKREDAFVRIRKDSRAVQKVQSMFEEYCNTHKMARAARSAIPLFKQKVTELSETLYKNSLETLQMEWLYDQRLSYHGRQRLMPHNIIVNDELSPVVLNLNRAKFLEKLQFAMSSITISLEGLQDCERSSVSAEAQLERAMGWACAGSNKNTMLKTSGIPSEFHDHLLRRRQLVWAAQEQASNIMGICTTVMEFEASRDGLFRIPGETSSHGADGKSWKQAYMNVLTRLDVTYHSFTRAEQEWKQAKSRMEAALDRLFSASNEFSIVSTKAKSSSGDLQNNLTFIRGCVAETCTTLSDFSNVSRGHTVLTSVCGSMLEEVVGVTEDLYDVYSIGKEALFVHKTLMSNLSKVMAILLPLGDSLSADFSALEKETNIDILPIHGQAIYRSGYVRVKESIQSLKSLVPSITSLVEKLHSMMINLAQSASVHAGNLHKTLEEFGESQVLRPPNLALSRPDLSNSSVSYGDRVGDMTEASQVQNTKVFLEEHMQGNEWISPPGSTYSNATKSRFSSQDLSSRTAVDLKRPDVSEACFSNLSHVETSEISIPLHLNTDEEGSASLENLGTHDAKSESRIINVSEEQQDFSTSTSLPVIDRCVFESATLSEKIETMSHQEKGQGSNHDNTASQVIRGKRNAYAVSLMKRVEMKLEGREKDVNRTMDITEQVDFLIKQATNLDNLCNMFEGWTPWI